MNQAVKQQTLTHTQPPDFQEAWQMVASQLRMEMKRADYETWVQSLKPISYKEGVFRLGATNSYARDWVESRLRTRIGRLLEGVFNQTVTVHFSLLKGGGESARQEVVQQELQRARQGSRRLPLAVIEPEEEVATENTETLEEETEGAGGRKKTSRAGAKPAAEGGSPRKIQLQRAYGTERARVIQPERGMFLTKYFFANWLPLLGHSALTTVLAARSLCYWNPLNGELRNTVETDMSELAKLASVSVRTVKDVLNNELVKRYFLRYKVRRIMTANGVRTAGIRLQVRMDDPLTPEDQEQHHLAEEERWYTADFEDESEE